MTNITTNNKITEWSLTLVCSSFCPHKYLPMDTKAKQCPLKLLERVLFSV